PPVVFTLEYLPLSGYILSPSNIVCGSCSFRRSSGFHPSAVNVLCEDHFGSNRHIQDTLTHELIHMYVYPWQALR
ncbi:hypothetical protein EDC04DRAFT_2566770, partial [Pisolithus marmoratus]